MGFFSVKVLVVTQQCASIIDVTVLLPLHPSALAATWLVCRNLHGLQPLHLVLFLGQVLFVICR